MLTGRRAFEGATITDTLARILDHEPDWTALPTDTPATIRTLLERCLRKDPRRRLRDIADALIEIDDLSTPTASGSDVPGRLRAGGSHVAPLDPGGGDRGHDLGRVGESRGAAGAA